MLNNSETFSGTAIGSEEFLIQVVEFDNNQPFGILLKGFFILKYFTKKEGFLT